MSPSKFDKYIHTEPTQYANPYALQIKHEELSVVKEASACLEASSVCGKKKSAGIKVRKTKTASCKEIHAILNTFPSR